MSRISLMDGREFDFVNPDSTPLRIEDIALGLSREYRWSNQSRLKITVAEHCLFCSELSTVPDSERLGILLHDASECVMRDISSPLKDLLPDYQAIETRVQLSIWRSFGITPPPEDLIAKVDRISRTKEQKGTRCPYGTTQPLGSKEVNDFFLGRFHELWVKFGKGVKA